MDFLECFPTHSGPQVWAVSKSKKGSGLAVEVGHELRVHGYQFSCCHSPLTFRGLLYCRQGTLCPRPLSFSPDTFCSRISLDLLNLSLSDRAWFSRAVAQQSSALPSPPPSWSEGKPFLRSKQLHKESIKLKKEYVLENNPFHLPIKGK